MDWAEKKEFLTRYGTRFGHVPQEIINNGFELVVQAWHEKQRLGGNTEWYNYWREILHSYRLVDALLFGAPPPTLTDPRGTWLANFREIQRNKIKQTKFDFVKEARKKEWPYCFMDKVDMHPKPSDTIPLVDFSKLPKLPTIVCGFPPNS